MVQYSIHLDYRRDDLVTKYSKKWKLNKHDTVLKMIDHFEVEESQEQPAKDKEFKELDIGGVD